MMELLSVPHIQQPMKVNNFIMKFTVVYSESENHNRAQKTLYQKMVKYFRQAYSK